MQGGRGRHGPASEPGRPRPSGAPGPADRDDSDGARAGTTARRARLQLRRARARAGPGRLSPSGRREGPWGSGGCDHGRQSPRRRRCLRFNGIKPAPYHNLQTASNSIPSQVPSQFAPPEATRPPCLAARFGTRTPHRPTTPLCHIALRLESRPTQESSSRRLGVRVRLAAAFWLRPRRPAKSASPCHGGFGPRR